MEIKRFVLVCVLWCLLSLFDLTNGNLHKVSDNSPPDIVQYDSFEPRGKHRYQLLFPLLIRISTRLATLVPTALMGLMGIILFVFFSKKALIVSLLALFLSVSGRINGKDEIHINKVNSYADYNDEEEHFYYHRLPMKHNGRPYYKKKRKINKKIFPSMPDTSYFVPLHRSGYI